jgi:hypothetical protein
MNEFQFTTVSALLTDRTSVEVTQVARKDRSRKNCDPLFCWHLAGLTFAPNAITAGLRTITIWQIDRVALWWTHNPAFVMQMLYELRFGKLATGESLHLPRRDIANGPVFGQETVVGLGIEPVVHTLNIRRNDPFGIVNKLP